MKKLISLLLAFTFAISLCVCTTAFADEPIVVPDPVGELKNVALGKNAMSNYSTAANATDGNYGNWWLNDFLGHDLIVDLGRKYTIEQILLYDRNDAYGWGENANAQFHFSNTADFSRDVYTVKAQNVDDGAVIKCNIEDAGKTKAYRYVKVTGNLFIIELVVNAIDNGTTEDEPEDDAEPVLINLSAGKTDAWSRGSYYDWSAKCAFDGTSTPYHCGSTDDGGGGGVDLVLNGVTYKYFAVNLEKPYLISNISWGSRGTGYGENINIIVDLSNKRDFSGDVYTVETNSTGGDGAFTFDAEVSEQPYKYVRFRTTSNFYITEMYIYGYEAPGIVADEGEYNINFETDFSYGTVYATASYTPLEKETRNFNGLLALYKGDELISCSIFKSKNNVASMSAVTSGETTKAVAYIWSGFKNIKPITKSVVLNKSDRINPIDFVDFTVEVEQGREPVILQLTDTQIIDGAQKRYEDRLDSALDARCVTENIEPLCFDYITEIVEAVNPDLILITGDLVYGEFDDSGSSLLKLIDFMEGFNIPWAPVFGNHDNESVLGADWQCEQLENAQNCLFKQRNLTGNGNYTVGVTQNGVLKRVFVMLDSNGCGGMSSATINNGHSKSSVGFGDDQIKWYTDVANKINRLSPGMKYSFAYHIQQEIFRTALSKYGTVNSNTINNPINIDAAGNKADTDFGYIGRDLKYGWDTDFAIFNGMKALGADSLFVGHEHCNSASVVYDGVRFQYGQKSSGYDRLNFMQPDGTYIGAYVNNGTPIVGGTVMKMSETDGNFTDAYIYYCKTADN